MEQQLWYLEDIDLTNVFCPKRTGNVPLELSANQYVYLPEEPAQKIYLVTAGRIKIGTYGADGKEITKAILTPGEVFGEMALIGQESRRDFAYVIEPARVCVLERTELQSMLRQRSDLQLFFMKLIGDRTLRLEQRLENLMFKSSRCRIIEFLHNLASTRGRVVGFEREVGDMLTHKEIADLTGTSRQTVNSVLNELRRDNVLTFNRKRMLVRDMSQLRAAS